MTKFYSIGSVLASAVMLCACATSKVSLKRVTEGDLSGDVKIQIPSASVELFANEVEIPDPKDPNKKIKQKKWDIKAVYVPSDMMYIASPVRRRWVDTELAPIYKSGTSQLESLGVETKDKRAEFASKIVDIASIIGADLTFFDADEESVCKGITQAELTASMEGISRGVSEKTLARDNCPIKLELGSISPDAVSVVDFESHIDAGKNNVRIIPFAACRPIKITYDILNLSKELVIPDANYLRAQKLPFNGKLTFDGGCGVPSIEAEGDQTPNDLEALENILKAFQNEEADNSGANQTPSTN